MQQLKDNNNNLNNLNNYKDNEDENLYNNSFSDFIIEFDNEVVDFIYSYLPSFILFTGAWS